MFEQSLTENQMKTSATSEITPIGMDIHFLVVDNT